MVAVHAQQYSTWFTANVPGIATNPTVNECASRFDARISRQHQTRQLSGASPPAFTHGWLPGLNPVTPTFQMIVHLRLRNTELHYEIATPAIRKVNQAR